MTVLLTPYTGTLAAGISLAGVFRVATIEERGPHQYRVKIRRRGQTVTKTFERRRDAEDWALEQEGKIVGGTYVDRRLSERTTLTHACDFYERFGLKPNIPDAKNQRSKLRYWRNSRFANWSITAIKPLDLIEWRRTILDEDNADPDAKVWAGPGAECSVQTVLHRINVLKYVFDCWRTHKDVNLASPTTAKGVRPPTPHARDRRLEPGEEKRLLSKLEKAKEKYPWLKAAFIIAVETAMRQSELAGLTWRHVQLTGKEPHVGLPATATKNSKPRTVPLSRAAIAAFRSLRPSDTPPLASVLPVETADSVGRAWREIVSDEDHPDLHWHDLRHEATSRLFDYTDLRDQEIMDITGHSDPRMLMRYTHIRARRHARRLNGKRAA